MKVLFPLIDATVDVLPGTSVSVACERAGIPLDLVCGGNGTCGKCRVDVIERGERKNVLGCQYPVSEGMQVLRAQDASDHQLLETPLATGRSFAPGLRCVSVSYGELATPMGGYDYDTLAAAVRAHGGPVLSGNPSYEVVRVLSKTYRNQRASHLNVIVLGDEVVALRPGDAPQRLLGAAVDIGTTSVVAFLYDMSDGTLLGQASALNGQIAYGADVVSRIDHASQSAGNLALEQGAICRTVGGLLTELSQRCAIQKRDIYEIVYCGNSTMQHLFAGLDPTPLGRSPFTGCISQALDIPAEELPIPINPHGHHIFLPLLGGFVGGDTTACLLDLPRDGKVRMMLDMGTNCEVAVGTDERMLVASTACGPALEGAGLSQGMRATTGAIERVTYEDGRFTIETVGGAAPQGYCGSGIVDIVAALLKSGIINSKGGFLKGRKLSEHPLASRVKTDEDGLRFFELLSAQDNPAGKAILVTLKDIRAIQLAKSAIYTGCTLLNRAYGIEPSQLEEICLAGAFGNYIDIPHAQDIGLIPRIPGVPVRSIGNGAGLGVQKCLLDQGELEHAERLRQRTTHVELAESPDFTDVYLQSMSFSVNLLGGEQGA